VIPEGEAKTSIVFSLRDGARGLPAALNVFERGGIAVIRIESRPRPGAPWEYLFYVDLAGPAHDPRVAGALEGLAEHTDVLRLLGSYPKFKRSG
jgi:prephenate dehydratase